MQNIEHRMGKLFSYMGKEQIKSITYWNQDIEAKWELWKAEQDRYGTASRIFPARIIGQNLHVYLCAYPKGDKVEARLSGVLRSQQRQNKLSVVIGDWVVVEIISNSTQDRAENPPHRNSSAETARIVDLLPRKSTIERWAAGDSTHKQIIVANIDYILLVFALDGGRNFHSNLIERCLTAVGNSSAQPIIVLNKIDCADEMYKQQSYKQAKTLALQHPVYLVSAKTRQGIPELVSEFPIGSTIAMLGKSGVGKSALVNAFLSANSSERSEVAEEGTVRSDRKGKHKTTKSQLYPLAWGAFVADVPGLRELKIWGDEVNLQQTFPEIDELALQCRFRNCSHEGELGCAIQNAIDTGGLDIRRFESYKKLRAELIKLDQRKNEQMKKEAGRTRQKRYEKTKIW